MLRRVVLVLMLALVASSWLAAPAQAAWASTAPGPARAGATTIAPTGTLIGACVALSAKVTLTWVASPSSVWLGAPPFGYEVLWGTTSGTYTSSGTATVLTFTTPSLALGTYYFVVRATKGSWRSTNSNQVSKTVISVLGVGTCV